MSDRIKLSELKIQSDSVWSNQDIIESDNFQASRLYPLLRDSRDLSSLNTSLIDLAQGIDEELQLSPLRANFLRAFDWHSLPKVLEVGCAGGSITRFLAEQAVKVDAIEPNRSLAQIAAIRTKKFPKVRVIAESFNKLDFESEKYDAIVLAGITDYSLTLLDTTSISFQQAVTQFLSVCKRLLSPEGKIYLVADNSHGIKYSFGAIDERTLKPYFGYQCGDKDGKKQTLNLYQWRSLLSQLCFENIDEYYLFPDFRFPKVLLGRKYVTSHQHAFQHLEGIPSVDYYHPLDIGISEFLIYQTLTASGNLGEFANSCLFVLDNSKSNNTDNPDFVHFPDYSRRKEYLSIVTKRSSETVVRRIRLNQDDSAVEINLKQDFQAEKYVQGIQLSILWMRSILHDPHGIKFEQYLLEYFDFLKKLESGVFKGMNIDAIANNVVVNHQGKYHLIDREWQFLDEKTDSVYVFYRAIVHFGLRNDSIFHQFKWIHALVTFTDFLFHCFKIIGITPTIEDLERMRIRDCEFLDAVLKDSDGYQLSNAFGQIGSGIKSITFINWRYYHEGYNEAQKIVWLPEMGHDLQQLVFSLPRVERKIECFRFFPFQHLKSQIAGYFAIESVMLKSRDEFNHLHTIWSLNSSDEVNEANIHKGIFYGTKESDSVFMFNNNDTFLEFNLPDYSLDNGEELQIEISFRLTPSHDYEIARHEYGLAQRVMDEKLSLREDEFNTLKKKLKQLNKELNEVKGSRIWRLLMAYRDSFKHTGYPEKSFFGKISQLIKRYKSN